MKAHVLRVGKGRTRWADAAVEDYAKRLRRSLPFSEERVKPSRFRGDEQAVRDAEAQALLSRVKGSDRLIALDERGDLPTTEEFAGLLDQAARLGTGRVVFAIGGPYGHGEAVRAAAWRTIAFGRMVVNHELARVLLAEQLYRASSLLWGGSYHH